MSGSTFELKPAFAQFFEDVNMEEFVENSVVSLIRSRIDISVNCSEFRDINPIEKLSDECIYSLFEFRSGFEFLLDHLDELRKRDLHQYIFSSRFITEEKLLEILLSPFMEEHGDDECLAHLAHNPLIYEQ